MQLPRENSAYGIYYRYGRYVIRRLRREGLNDLADSCKLTNDKIRTLGRAWEDAEDPVQDGLADRDAADDTLDGIAQNARLQLASQSVSASRENPYLQIFPSGIDYYILAPVDQEVNRYNELISRMVESLPETDSVRQEAIPLLQTQVADYSTAAANLSTLRTAESIARTNLEVALDDWQGMMEKLYGSLVNQFGKRKADRFFPRATRSRTADGSSAPAKS